MRRGDERGAIIEDHSCPHGQGTHQPVPHHPPSLQGEGLDTMATGETTPTYSAVVEEDIVAMHVAMEYMFLEVLDEGSLQLMM